MHPLKKDGDYPYSMLIPAHPYSLLRGSMTFLHKSVLHTFLFASFPILSLLSHNFQQIQTRVVIIPLAVSLAFAYVILGVMRLIFRDWLRAAWVSTIIVLFFFTYGHLYRALEDIQIFGVFLGRHRVLVPLSLAVLAGSVWWGARRKTNLHETTFFLNVFAILAIGITLFQMGSIAVRQAGSLHENPFLQAPSQKLTLPGDQAPDIYYIILDSYARDDALLSDFGFDNSQFTGQLREMGFFVADCARSNYPWTRLSLVSSLNMTYLETPEQLGGKDGVLLPLMLKNNRVRKLLEESGYTTVAFETGFIWSEWSDADHYISTPNSMSITRMLEPFISLFSRQTAFKVVDDFFPDLVGNQIDLSTAERQYQRQIYILDRLETVPSISGPKFVFAHIILPHQPYVFAADGSFLEDADYRSKDGEPANQEYHTKGYLNQLQYANSRMIPFLQKIMSESDRPAVIILQGDHGARGKNRHKILNAYYFPDREYGLMNNSISPINTFRVIFNTYFGTHFERLPDLSFISQDELSNRLSPVEEDSLYCLSINDNK